MNSMTKIIIWVVLIAGISYGGWHLKRWFNWTYGYGSDVTEAICVMVKPEALINPEDCK